MPSVGEQLRATRLRLGLTLEQVCTKTRIPVKNLEAIERDEVTQISSAFFYKSFVRQMSEVLQHPYEQLAPQVEDSLLMFPEPKLPGEGEPDRPWRGRIALRRPRNFRWLYSVGSLIAVVCVCTLLYSSWQNKGWPIQSFQTAANGVRSSLPDWVQGPTSFLFGKSDGTLLSSRSGHVDPEYRIEVSALESTWLSIVEDGKQTFRGVLDADQTKILEGRQTARIRTGNAGGISCIFNGKPIGTLGPRGQMRTVVFTRSHYQVLDSPAPVAWTILPLRR